MKNLLSSYSVCLILFFIINAELKSQDHSSSNIYRPQTDRLNDSGHQPDTGKIQPLINQDSLDARQKYVADSINARMLFVQDSILKREAFVRDSIEKREAFILDSIARRKRILDSLNFLIAELPKLLDASLKTSSENIIISYTPIKIVGDSMLSNYEFKFLPFSYDKPYIPWKSAINLSDNPVAIDVDTIAKKIKSIKTPHFTSYYQYGRNKNVVRINYSGSILNRQSVKYYKSPFDSVFFDSKGRVAKIKKYIHYYTVVNNFQRGKPLLLHLHQVRQYNYAQNGLMSKYQTSTFCDRWSERDPKKVCSIVNYLLGKEGNTYNLTRQYEPANQFSDGTWNFVFDQQDILKSVNYKNSNGSEDWKVIIELNRLGYVSRYVYQNKGSVHKTLLVYYKLDDPAAKYKVETITCIFEDDGVCYYQENNMTGERRTRDKMTLEWSPWR